MSNPTEPPSPAVCAGSEAPTRAPNTIGLALGVCSCWLAFAAVLATCTSAPVIPDESVDEGPSAMQQARWERSTEAASLIVNNAIRGSGGSVNEAHQALMLLREQHAVERYGWIGAGCESDNDCDSPSTCDAFSQLCTMPCDGGCPDRSDAPTTVCADFVEGGQCAARCDFGLFPDTGCPTDARCRLWPRLSLTREVDVGTCLPVAAAEPGTVDPLEQSDCLAGLRDAGVDFELAAFTPESPSSRSNATCELVDPVLVRSPINGVWFRGGSEDSGEPNPMLMSCDMAAATLELAEALTVLEIVEVRHYGVTSCRTIGRSGHISQHGYGRALDIATLYDALGVYMNVEEHWERNEAQPSTREGRILRELATILQASDTFQYVLTPDYDRSHEDHIHIDIE